MFQQALARCEGGETGGIIVAKLDRFARSAVDALDAIRRLNDSRQVLLGRKVDLLLAATADIPLACMIAELESFESRSGGEQGMTAQAGDLIVVESERITQPVRRGVIEEVLQEKPPRFRIRWDDGHTSIFTPSAGAARIEERKRARKGLTPG